MWLQQQGGIAPAATTDQEFGLHLESALGDIKPCLLLECVVPVEKYGKQTSARVPLGLVVFDMRSLRYCDRITAETFLRDLSMTGDDAETFLTYHHSLHLHAMMLGNATMSHELHVAMTKGDARSVVDALMASVPDDLLDSTAKGLIQVFWREREACPPKKRKNMAAVRAYCWHIFLRRQALAGMMTLCRKGLPPDAVTKVGKMVMLDDWNVYSADKLHEADYASGMHHLYYLEGGPGNNLVWTL